MRILGISGSLRQDSYNGRLLATAAAKVPGPAKIEPWLGLRELPHYDPDLDAGEPGPVVADLRASLAAADGLLLVTPEYNGTIPGVLKNMVDWASRPFPDNALRGLPAAVIGASEGLFGAVWAQAELRKALGIAGANVIERDLPIGLAQEAFDGDALKEEAQAEALSALLAELVDAVGEKVPA